MPVVKRFQAYIERFEGCNPQLPLVHTLTTNSFRRCLSKRKIRPEEKCDVFHEYLVYLFYGRPAYKVQCDKPDQRNYDEYLPVAIVLSGDSVRSIKRVFPFDSGGFDLGYYRSVQHDGLRLSDYQLSPNLSAAQQVVDAFFGSNEAYLLGEVVKRRSPNPFDEPEVCTHIELIQGPSEADVDDRRYTIEVQTKSEIELSSGVLALVMPHTWLSSSAVQDFLRDNPGVHPATYARFKGATLPGCHAVIMERVHEFLEANSYLGSQP